jgi:hypothetical protein
MQAYNAATARNDLLPFDEALDAAQLLKVVFNEMGKKFFHNWQASLRRQKSYMRSDLYMGNMNPEKFVELLKKMNKYLKFYPQHDPFQDITELAVDELLDVLNNSKKNHWLLQMMQNAKNPDDFTSLEEAKDYYVTLYQSDQMVEKLNAGTNKTEKSDKSSKKKNGKRKHSETDTEAKPWAKPKCSHCSKVHKSDDCWMLEKNKNKRPKFYKPPGAELKNDKITFSNKQFSHLLKNLAPALKQDQKPKRKVTEAETYLAALTKGKDSDEEIMSDSE